MQAGRSARRVLRPLLSVQDIMEEPAPRMFWPKVVWSKCVLARAPSRVRGSS